MNRISGVAAWAAVSVVLSAGLSSGADMDRKQTRALESAQKGLEKAAEKLADYEGEAGKKYSDRVAEGLERTLERTAEKLAELPAEGAGVSAAQERLRELQARIRRLVEAKGSLGARAFLGPKLAKKLNTIDVQLSNLAAELERYGSEEREFNDRLKGRYEKQIGELATELTELPAENPIVKALADRLAESRQLLDAMSKDLGAALAARAEAEAARQALLDAPAFKGDLERVSGLVESFREGGLLNLEAYYLRNPLPTSEEDQALALAEQWEGFAAESRGLLQKYAVLGEGRSNPMWISIRELKEWLPRFEEAVKAFKSGAPAKLAEVRKGVETLAQEAVAKKHHRAFSDPIGKLRGEANYVRRVAALQAKLGDPSLEAAAQQLEAFLIDEQEKLAADIVASNRAPSDAYAGGDKAALEEFVRAQWGEHFASEKILAVRFPNEAFRRTVAWRWDGGRKQAYKVDQSDLWICVIVQRGEEAVLYDCFLRKLHLDGDRMILRWRRPERVPPSDRMKVSNL